MSTMKKLAAAMGITLISATVSAADITYYPPLTGFEDDDRDWFVDNNSNGTLDVGDRLVGVVEYGETYSILGSGTSQITSGELTGVFDLTVISKTSTGTIDLDEDTATTNDIVPIFTFQFGATGDAGLLSGHASGTLVALYVDDADTLNLLDNSGCTSLAQCVSQASDDTLWADVGFNGDSNETWRAINALDLISLVQAGAASTKYGEFNFRLSVLTNNTGQIIIPHDCLNDPFNTADGQCAGGGDGKVDVIGSGDILGGLGLTGGAVARSDGDFQIATAAVPEPGTLALFGVSLLGLALSGRRRKWV